ncbi:MAG: SGNH/GDSL hydrolase family protein [Lachnospiraceae bacterium]|nr:SGNH/GDSL hydrolase family protein [Lachnospiraceae bacterium]
MAESRGPVAPKDPTAKRPFYYIMRDKDICASPQPDGTGVMFIFESDGRLGASAKLVGNLEDETMLSELFTVEGFRKQVHSIGVSVQKAGDPVDVKFAFQMYGKTDPYTSGTTLTMDLVSDGMEMVMELDKYEWSDDDNVTGQIRFEFPEPGIAAKVSVAFYLNDGYTAPEQKDDKEVDITSDAYKKMIERSLMQKGNPHRLKAALDKARRGEKTYVSFIGGSITQGAGAIPINTECYAYNAFKGFCDIAGRGYGDNVIYTKAGVGGTPSEVGILRYESDVLHHGERIPDVVVVEFAVNDEGDETKGEFFDSLVRRIYNSPQKPAVVLLYSVFVDGYNLQDRLKCVGEAYNLPMVSIKDAVYDQFYLSEEEGGVVSKNRYFYDMYHPTNIGHRIMADGLINMFKAADASEDEEDLDISSITPPKGNEFENVYLVDRSNIDTCPAVEVYATHGFTGKSEEVQYAEHDLDTKGSPEFPNNWLYDGSKNGEAMFMLRVKCSALMVAYMDSASIDVGCAEVYVDGEKVLDIDPHLIGWQHCNALIVFRGGPSKVRDVLVKITDKEKKFILLGFGIVD